jgi:hypothetical protein
MKIMISYDMRKGKEQECQDYLVNKLAPGLGRLGFRFSDVWYTIWGKSPQILGGGEVKDAEQAQEIFSSTTWERMVGDLEPLTENLRVRLLRTKAENSQ